MQVCLTVLGGKHSGREIPITGPEFLIGRDKQCRLRPSSDAVSRVHCAIVIRDESVFLRDHGSRNGTVVSNRVLRRGELQLQHGDKIRVGPLSFAVSIRGDVREAAGQKMAEPQILGEQEPSPDKTAFFRALTDEDAAESEITGEGPPADPTWGDLR